MGSTQKSFGRRHSAVRTIGWILWVMVYCLPLAASAQVGEQSGAFELRPGVLIDSERQRLYAMNPAGGIDAVELSSGAVAFTTDRAAKPLMLMDDVLIAQAEPTGRGPTLEIVFLDSASLGERSRARVLLPADVEVAIDDALEGSFVASAHVYQGQPIVSWSYSRRTVRGAAPEAGLPPELRRRGDLRVDSISGQLEVLEPGDVPAPVRPWPNLPADQSLPGLPSLQFVSADGRHVLISERVDDDRTWNKYEWTFYQRADGGYIGTVRHHVSQAPFLVAGTQLVYEMRPYLRRHEGDFVQERLQIRAVDVQGGVAQWSHRIRDTTYRGPFPP